jgi:putative hydrolase of the HAD superfamily
VKSVILFDLFGVLLSKGFPSSSEKLSRLLNREAKKVKAAYERWEPPFDLGGLSEAKFWYLVQRDLCTTVDWKLLNETVLKSYYPIDGSLALLKRYATKAPVYLLSNTRREWFEYLDATFKITHHVADAFLSYRMGLLKPDPAFFFHVIETVGVSPGDVLYVDDCMENVRAARSLGINAHRFIDSVSAERFIAETVHIAYE